LYALGPLLLQNWLSFLLFLLWDQTVLICFRLLVVFRDWASYFLLKIIYSPSIRAEDSI